MDETVSLEPDENAPYGYTIDTKTGERRPKKRAGRPRVTSVPVPQDAQDLRLEDELPAQGEDAEPGKIRHVHRFANRREARAAKAAVGRGEPEPVPTFRAGPIAKGINKLYRRAGRIAQIWDAEVGQAIIATTAKIDEDDTTVGEAWEEIARTNPRIRAFLLKLISGGAWGQLLMAHLPIALAIFMKDTIRERIPFANLAGAVLDTDEVQGDGGLNLQGMDIEAMMGAMMGSLAPMMDRMNTNTTRPPQFDPGAVDGDQS